MGAQLFWIDRKMADLPAEVFVCNVIGSEIIKYANIVEVAKVR